MQVPRCLLDLSELKELDKKAVEFTNGVKKQWERTLQVLEGSDGQRIVTSKNNFVKLEEDGTGIYADHIAKKQFRVNYSDRNLQGSSDIEEGLEEKKQELVDLISNPLKKYLQEFFSQGSHLYGSASSISRFL